ncbi:hypothetical protein ACWGID_24700 [Kribbella sp. NPDC054772]|jgi:hypothetical protein
MKVRRCRSEPDPYAADLVRRLRGLLAIVTRPPAKSQNPVRRDDELLDRL